MFDWLLHEHVISDAHVPYLKMPPITKMRGWPKGHMLTTVGLPTRKGKAASKPTSFIDLHFFRKAKRYVYLFMTNRI